MSKEQTQQQTATLEVTQREHSLILFNDHENTFDHVIDMLCTICNHDELQAEQCAWITHYKGKCVVLEGSYNDLEPKASLMGDAGLTVHIH